MSVIVKKFKFSPGDEVKEIITGFKGIITGIAFYITGCNQYLIVAKPKNNTEEAKGVWYDQDRIELVKSKKIILELDDEGDGADKQAPNKG